MTNLEKQLQRVYWGKIDFGEFVANTRSEFAALARHLLRRWPAPEFFNTDDAEQELYLGVWNYVWRFDETRGVKMSRFVVYNAYQAAKTALHKARGVTISGTPDKKPSNIETPLSFFGDDNEGEALVDRLLSEEPIAEMIIIAEEERRATLEAVLQACESPQERYAVLAIRDAGSIDDAGTVLYSDPDLRLDLRLNNEDHAERFVFRQVTNLACRLRDCVKST